MAIIIKGGNLNKAKKNSNRMLVFKCWACSCVFSALDDEYKQIKSAPFLYDCQCPCCGEECYSAKLEDA